MDFNFIQSWHNLAVNEYHVNPTVFIVIMVVTTPLFWLGWAWIIKEIIALKKSRDKDPKKLIQSIVFYLIIWVAPYAYVIIFGKNLPVKFWIIFGTILTVSAFLVYRKIRNALNNKQ
jgi:hypothetical protein